MAIKENSEIQEKIEEEFVTQDISDAGYSSASQKKGPRSDSSKPDTVEVLYVKDHVMIHPTQRLCEKIIGRLGILKKGSSVFLTWLPFKTRVSGTDLANATLDKILFTIRAVPVTDVLAIRLHPPTTSWQCIIIFLSSGLTFPGLNFFDGGVHEFLAALEQHVSHVRSPDDANIYIVNDFQDPLKGSLSSLERLGVVSVANAPSTSLSPGSLDENSERTQNESSSGWHLPKFHDPASALAIQMLDRFSPVPKFAWETASQLFHGRANERKNHVPDILDIPADPIELDKLTLVWGKPRDIPLEYEELISFVDTTDGRILNSMDLRKRIFYGGLASSLREEVWKLLLGYHEYDSTYPEREQLASVKKLEYETLKLQWQSISPAQAKNFSKFTEWKQIIENDVVRTDRSVPFYEGEDNPNVTVLRDILLTYSFYNFDIGYSQGMNDYLSPILYVMKDETQSFWCFVKLMERLGPNFTYYKDGMDSQLLALSKLVELFDCPLHNYIESIKQDDLLSYIFCFRWVLLQFKREFDYEDTMLLWDILWTRYPSEHFLLYICVAILKRHRNKIMGEQMDFVTIYDFLNRLSGHIDLHEVLRDAEALYLCAGKEGDACTPPSTPPFFSIEKQDDAGKEGDACTRPSTPPSFSIEKQDDAGMEGDACTPPSTPPSFSIEKQDDEHG